jgi:hypothetical protein
MRSNPLKFDIVTQWVFGNQKVKAISLDFWQSG